MEMDHIYTLKFLYIDSYLFAVMLMICSKDQVQPMEGSHQPYSKEPVCPALPKDRSPASSTDPLSHTHGLHRNRNMTLSGAGEWNGADSWRSSYKHHRALGTTNLDQSMARPTPPLQFFGSCIRWFPFVDVTSSIKEALQIYMELLQPQVLQTTSFSPSPKWTIA